MSSRADPQIGARRFLRGPALINVNAGLRIFSQYAEIYSGSVLIRVLANDCLTGRELPGATQIVVVPRGLTTIEGDAPPSDEQPGAIYTARYGGWNANNQAWHGGIQLYGPLYEYLQVESFDVLGAPFAGGQYDVAQPVPGTTPQGTTPLGLSYTTGPLPVFLVAALYMFDGILLEVTGAGPVAGVSRIASMSVGWQFVDPQTSDQRPLQQTVVLLESYTYFDDVLLTTQDDFAPLTPYLGDVTYRSATVGLYETGKVRCRTAPSFALGSALIAPRRSLPQFGEPAEAWPAPVPPAARPPLTIPSKGEVAHRVGPRDPTGIMT